MLFMLNCTDANLRNSIQIITPYVERAPYTRKYLEGAEAIVKMWEESDKAKDQD
jgi:hypothetical protein